MKCEQCTFLQAQGGDSLPTESLDIPLWLQSNGNHIHVKSLENEQQTDGFPDWLCGKETLKTLTHPSTPELWIAFMQDSLVKTLVSLESKQALLKEPDQGFTEKSCVLLGQLDLNTFSWKMSQQLKATALIKLSKTWPSWGMTLDGCVYEHPMSGRRITAIDGLLWPTPTAHNAKEAGCPAEYTRKTPSLAAKAGGKLNPQWTEWLMGWPINHTVSKQLATVKSLSKLQSLSVSLVKD
jgi:hypothetical protein